MVTLGKTSAGNVVQLTAEDWKEWCSGAVDAVKAMFDSGDIDLATKRSEVQFIRGTYVGVLYQSEVYALSQDNRLTSLNISHMGKKRRCGWGKYVNLYYAYTEMKLRRQGLATALQRFLEEYWKGLGQDRLKSTAGSYGGFRFHRSLGHFFWGTNDKGELVVDAPLLVWDPSRITPSPGGLFPTTPRHARSVTSSLVPMSKSALISHLTSDACPYRITEDEAKNVR